MKIARIMTMALMTILWSFNVHAQGAADRSALEQSLKNYFTNYTTAPSGFQMINSLSSVRVDDSQRIIDITAHENFSAQEFTPQLVKNIYSQVKDILPRAYKHYDIRIRTHGQLIDQLIPNRLRDHHDQSRQWRGIDYEGKPWVTNVSRPNKITRGLEGRHLMIAASHGRYYAQKSGKWIFQRPNLFCTTEDLFTQTIVVPYLMPMLQNAGAVVCTPRERDWQKNEVIVDNDRPGNSYKEANGAHSWTTTPKQGFAYHTGTYTTRENPFKSGTARMAESSTSRLSTITYQPTIPEAGRYAVYVSYQTLSNSVDDAQYTVWHKGRRTVFNVNQRMGGGTWVYLGTFDFDRGNSPYNMVVLSNHSKSKGVVTADAVRFGGGMGNIERNGMTSGLPRCLEGARYTAHWAGAPDSVYDVNKGSNDYNDNLNTRARYNNWLAGGSPFVPNQPGLRVPIELMLSVHSDAGYDKTGGNDIYGTLAICTTDFYDGKLGAGISRLASRDLADALFHNVWEDIRAKYGKWKRRLIYDRNYNETRVPAVPSAILEVLSHQNFGDMRYGLDPNFRFTLARSIYKTLLRYVNEMHGTKYVVQPLAPRNFHIELTNKGKAKLYWNPVRDPQEPTADPTEYVVYTAIGDLDFDNGTVVKGTSCTVNIEPNTLYHFKVTAANHGGESFPTEVLSASYVPSAKKTVMVVNGFHRVSSPAVVDSGDKKGFDIDADPGVTYGLMAGWSGRQRVFDKRLFGREGEGALGYCGEEMVGQFIAGNDFNYVREHATAIHSAHKYNIISCSSEAFEAGKAKTSHVDCVDLLLGLEKDDGHSLLLYKTFSEEMQKRLRSYVRDHGNLLVSGSYVGSDMRTDKEKRFLSDVLKLRCEGISRHSSSTVQGLGMSFDTWHQLNATHYAATSFDVLNPLSTSYCVMRYANGLNAAVAYSGRDYRSFTMGFPLECIKDTRTRNAIMRGILNYLIP